MKKLLVTAIGAAAALGAFAGLITDPPLRFENVAFEIGSTSVDALNAVHGNYYWEEPANATNTYAIEAMGAFTQRQTRDIPATEGDPTKALSVKTTFGNPLTVNINADGSETNINAGVYFDSLVKFTVCEDAPEQDYAGAKIVMWLQEKYENDEIIGTNLVVKAGYLTGDNVTTNSSKVYVCGNAIPGDFADSFHRVTIKAISSIVEGNTKIPGFAIYIDGSDTSGNYQMRANRDNGDDCWDSTFAANFTLTEAAQILANGDAIFPSMIQTGASKMCLAAASFDGTGSLTDIIFTDEAPKFAKDAAAQKVGITLNGNPLEPFTSYEEAVEFVNDLASTDTAELTLIKGLAIDETLAFASDANVILDFAGVVITNTSASAAAISNTGASLTITNSIEGVGGIYCSDANGVALSVENGVAYITAGMFNGNIVVAGFSDAEISGGSFKQDSWDLGGYLVAGKVLQLNSGTGLYDVVDQYTITYNNADGTTFTSWAVGYTAPTAFTADSAVTLPVAANVDLGVVGVSFDGWTNALGQAVTTTEGLSADLVVFLKTAVVAPTEYTITFDAGANATVDPATTNYTMASGEITLPTAVPTGFGVMFGGWTNATYTTAIKKYTPAAGDGDFTLYAKWDAVAPCTITLVPGRNDATVSPSTINFWAGQGEIELPDAVLNQGVVGVTFAGWTNDTYTTAITNYTPPAENAASFTLYAKWDAVVQTYPSYINPSDATIVGQYNAWKTLYGADTASAYEEEFLLNVAPGTTGATIDATAISISGMTVTIDINRGNLNGYPYVKKAATVAGLKTDPTTVPVSITPADGTSRENNIDNGGRITLTDSGAAMFYQIGVQSEPVAVPNN